MKKCCIHAYAFVCVILILLTGCISEPEIISSYDGQPSTFSSVCYAPPKPGEYYCITDVNAARENYRDKNVAFLLAFDIFDASGQILSGSQSAAEHQRLIELGIELYKTTYVAYMENGEYVMQPITAGIFTEEQLADFEPDSYGYVFRFVKNADCTEFTVSEDEQLSAA